MVVEKLDGVCLGITDARLIADLLDEVDDPRTESLASALREAANAKPPINAIVGRDTEDWIWLEFSRWAGSERERDHALGVTTSG